MNQIFNVEGMTCGHCEKAVTKAVLALDPKATVNIDRQRNQVQIESEENHDALSQAIVDQGYRVNA